jgi:hypothetical protein
MAVIGAFLFTNRIVNHAELRGRSLLTNGLEEVRKYNPATGNWLPACLRPIRQAPAFAPVAGGLLTGDYTYRIVPYNVNEDEEGEAFPVDGAPNVAYQVNGLVNQSVNINLAALRIDSPETTAIRIYRTTALTVWPALALVGEVALPAGVFNDNTAAPQMTIWTSPTRGWTCWPRCRSPSPTSPSTASGCSCGVTCPMR